MKKFLSIFALIAAFAGLSLTSTAFAQGGNTTVFPNLSGSWQGTTFFPAPPTNASTTLALSQDASGNLTGTFCTQFCSPTSGKWINANQFQFKVEGSTMTGMVNGPVTCADGTTGNWISGSVQTRGGTGSFSYTTCAR